MSEHKEKMTTSEIQSVLRWSKLLSEIHVSNDFKIYHLAMVDQLDDDDEVESEQRVLDDHELKVMELIGSVLELIGKPSQSKTDPKTDLASPQSSIPAPGSTCTNDCLVDRHLYHLGDSVHRRAVERPNNVDTHVLTNYLDKIRSLEGELQGLRKYILSLDDKGEHT